jgi:hypothetical protein
MPLSLRTSASSAGSFERPADAAMSVGATSKCTTWPRACTPVSVRPAQTTRTDGTRSAVASASSSEPWTVRNPGWVAHPLKSVPS